VDSDTKCPGTSISLSLFIIFTSPAKNPFIHKYLFYLEYFKIQSSGVTFSV